MIIAFCSFYLVAGAQRSTVTLRFQLKETPAIIEGMTYDAEGRHFYFGESISKTILSYDRNGKPDGIINAAADGMTSVLGMNVNDGHLFVCGAIGADSSQMMCLFEYDLATRKLVNRYPDTTRRAKLFNDVAITSSGEIMITDSYTQSLYKVDRKNNAATLYMQSDSLRDANGITANGNTIFVSTSRGIAIVNTTDRSITRVQPDELRIAGIDGLYYYHNSLVGIHNVFFPVSVNQYFLNDTQRKIVKARTLSADDPLFNIPTTGAIVGNDLYFMNNNNIGKENSAGKNLEPVSVSSIKLLSR